MRKNDLKYCPKCGNQLEKRMIQGNERRNWLEGGCKKFYWYL